MLGIALILVGIVLVHNGVLFMSKTKVATGVMDENNQPIETLVPLVVHSAKTIAFFNAIVGGILVLFNLFMFAAHHAYHPFEYNYTFYQNVAAGLIFGTTYLFLAGNLLFKLDMRAFSWFSIGACIFALIMAGDNFIALANYGFTNASDALWLGLLWISWFFLWLTAPLQFILGIKKMQNIFPWVSIVVGIAGAFLPAILLLTGAWQLLG
ncbi:MAG: AmiS/UreI family transporter [Firmicutes bacterium]|nr:AmiS/UreI family transporter [Bacillota bacterium]